jgi:purine catabolism regulator
VVVVARLDSRNQTSIARSRENRWPALDEIMVRRGPRLLWRIRNNSAEVLWPCAGTTEARGIATTLHEELNRRIADPSTTVAVGSGQVRSGLVGIQQSHQEAKHALTMGRRLAGVGRLTRFEDLGVYRLIFSTEQHPELRAFHDEALNSLMEYDRAHSGDLIRTLKAFFDAKCGPKEAAGMLDVHRNTVLYRLERIREITGLDLDDADVRLRLHLALCIHLALFNKGE